MRGYILKESVHAEILNADGTTAAATTLHVRATEYTVGPNGPKTNAQPATEIPFGEAPARTRNDANARAHADPDADPRADPATDPRGDQWRP